MSFCDQMSAAIDGARTLTRLDHLSRSIWQGLAAGAVADDDAQALAERLHAGRRNLPNVIRIVSKEWTAWLARGGRSSRPAAEPLIGCKKLRPTDSRNKKGPSRTSERPFAARRQQADLAVHNQERQRH